MEPRDRRFLSDDHIYRDLALCLGLLAISGPILSSLSASSRIDAYLFAAFLVFALFQITRRATNRAIGLVLGIAAVAGEIANAATTDSPALNAGPVVATGLFMGFVVWQVLADVLTGSRGSSERVFGSIAVYFLLGVLFAHVHAFVALVDRDAYALSSGLAAELTSSDAGRAIDIFTYFSFVTMSTLGYGDLTPVSAVARALAWIQAVLGQLYLAVTVAALVGIHISEKRR
ncbi:MAG: potassium channel family protein [Thermoanaerobaculales bacterium]|jgi:hypothetical protein|nr:potassium channel family protein [Thermoanaerobaculales bacterium]